MSEAKARRLESAANIGILLAVILIAFVIARNHFAKPAGIADTIPPGKKFALPGINWQANPRNLVFVVSTTCHFCSESAPFYRQLVEQRRQKGVRTVAVLPQPAEEAAQYLGGEGVQVTETRQAVPAKLGVPGTPTILLIDAQGIVEKVWPGKLSPDREQEVVASIGR